MTTRFKLRLDAPRSELLDGPLGHLQNYGYVKRLLTSKGEQRILLPPFLSP